MNVILVEIEEEYFLELAPDKNRCLVLEVYEKGVEQSPEYLAKWQQIKQLKSDLATAYKELDNIKHPKK